MTKRACPGRVAACGCGLRGAWARPCVRGGLAVTRGKSARPRGGTVEIGALESTKERSRPCWPSRTRSSCSCATVRRHSSPTCHRHAHRIPYSALFDRVRALRHDDRRRRRRRHQRRRPRRSRRPTHRRPRRPPSPRLRQSASGSAPPAPPGAATISQQRVVVELTAPRPPRNYNAATIASTVAAVASIEASRTVVELMALPPAVQVAAGRRPQTGTGKGGSGPPPPGGGGGGTRIVATIVAANATEASALSASLASTFSDTLAAISPSPRCALRSTRRACARSPSPSSRRPTRRPRRLRRRHHLWAVAAFPSPQSSSRWLR